MNNPQTYEKIIKVKSKGRQLVKQISAVMCYVLFFALGLSIGLNNIKGLVPIAVVDVLCTAALAGLTWKYFQLEYECSFWYGRLAVAKIYGKKKRKSLVDTEMKSLLMIAPATEEYIARAEHLDIKKRITAISQENAENIWLAVTGEEDEPRILIFFEADERCLDMLRNANRLAFVQKH